MTKILETNRLTLRHVHTDDAPFILRLLNEPSWLQNIGDRHVRTLQDAESYIEYSFVAMYTRHGFGMFLVELNETQASIGLCGLIKREGLDDVDLGFAFLPEYWGKGYAFEAASPMLSYGKTAHDLSRLVAITLPTNSSSMNLLTKLGFQLEGTICLPNDTETLNLYGFEL